ncbi:hypothetical protein B0H17DRAFT_1151614 [Mycena rosella]|uniref:HAT C-terminal dimerisation domain-containing protein n=1 Tax=Mycena rosella TaxID=1033263 RepID=A0AAD7BJJ6_MYCRO|nr:hypothetical protein B0H17DRAFT_1151614 [Mycena rosella]
MDTGPGLTGRGGFIKLAIRILSMVPNSAGPERVFSIYGITHTKHRNRLNPLKVHKSTTVRMDCQDSHRAAGLVPDRRPRNFSLAEDQDELAAMDTDISGSAVSPTSESNTDSVEADMDFSVMSAMLVDLAAREDADEAAETRISETVATAAPPPPPSASASVTNPALRIPACKKLKLVDLFLYPAPGTPAAELEFFWKDGINGLDQEEESLAADAAAASQAARDAQANDVSLNPNPA